MREGGEGRGVDRDKRGREWSGGEWIETKEGGRGGEWIETKRERGEWIETNEGGRGGEGRG